MREIQETDVIVVIELNEDVRAKNIQEFVAEMVP